MTRNSAPRRQQTGHGGRPRKFKETSRPITVTLPERTLRLLGVINADRAKAIVKATDAIMAPALASNEPVRLTEIEKGKGVIVVGPTRRLREIPWLKLVEITPGSSLLVIPSGTAPEKLEVAIMDLLPILGQDEVEERRLMEALLAQISNLRRTKRMTHSEIIIVDM
jgi:hypothetical protein